MERRRDQSCTGSYPLPLGPSKRRRRTRPRGAGIDLPHPGIRACRERGGAKGVEVGTTTGAHPKPPGPDRRPTHHPQTPVAGASGGLPPGVWPMACASPATGPLRRRCTPGPGSQLRATPPRHRFLVCRQGKREIAPPFDPEKRCRYRKRRAPCRPPRPARPGRAANRGGRCAEGAGSRGRARPLSLDGSGAVGHEPSVTFISSESQCSNHCRSRPRRSTSSQGSPVRERSCVERG